MIVKIKLPLFPPEGGAGFQSEIAHSQSDIAKALKEDNYQGVIHWSVSVDPMTAPLKTLIGNVCRHLNDCLEVIICGRVEGWIVIPRSKRKGKHFYRRDILNFQMNRFWKLFLLEQPPTGQSLSQGSQGIGAV